MIGRTILLMLAFLLGSGMGTINCWIARDMFYHQEAIKHKAAHYDAETGEFKWNQ